jgi:16S rRNA (adenine1518-N6/adenine1519-N6)-dimethyltransferase
MEFFRPKKSLGQNFLTSEAAVFKIVQAAEISPGETVLEIGPGKGVLTRALLDVGAHVVAVEKDTALAAKLLETFAGEVASGALRVVEGDALEISTDEILRTAGADSYKVVANLPYYITGQFLRMSLSAKHQPSRMVLLLQKEVVERIVAADKKESLLSIAVKVYGEPKKITVVRRGSFFPIPNVDSAVIAIEDISKTAFMQAENNARENAEENFFNILRAGFAHKRKMLIANLAEAGVAPREKILAVFTELTISEKIRAEDLTKDQWLLIARKLAGV